MYGWMDGWSCVGFTIFSLVFLKLDYKHNKKARLLWPLSNIPHDYCRLQNRKKKRPTILIGDTTDQLTFLLESLHFLFISQRNTTQHNEITRSDCGLWGPTTSLLPAILTLLAAILFLSPSDLASNTGLLALPWTCWCTLIAGSSHLLFPFPGSPGPWIPTGFSPSLTKIAAQRALSRETFPGHPFSTSSPFLLP